MFPIVWLPFLVVSDNPTAKDFCINRGASRILGSDVQLSNYAFNPSNIVFGGYGLELDYGPTASQSTKLSLCLGEDYTGLWSGFTISAHVRINPNDDSDLFVIRNGLNILKVSKTGSNLNLYLSSSGSSKTVSYDVSSWESFVHIALLVDLSNVQVYIDGIKTNDDISFNFMGAAYQSYFVAGYDDTRDMGNFSANITICNLRVYDSKISKRKLLEDRSFLFAHYIFDGDNANIEEDTNRVMTEYDTCGTGFDVTYLYSSGNGFTITADSSPSREISSYATAEDICFPIKLHGSYCIMFWARNVSNGNVSLLRLVHDLYPEQSDLSGRRFVALGSSSQQTTVFELTDSDWHLCMAEINTVNGSTTVKMSVDLRDAQLIPNSDIIKTAGTTLDNIGLAVSNCSISDIMFYGQKPTDSELSVLYNRNVVIDKNGTVCATKLDDIPYVSSIGFGSRGHIKAQSFSDNGNSHIMKYDYTTGNLDISDFEEK